MKCKKYGIHVTDCSKLINLVSSICQECIENSHSGAENRNPPCGSMVSQKTSFKHGSTTLKNASSGVKKVFIRQALPHLGEKGQRHGKRARAA